MYRYRFLRFPGGLSKAVTFSYDDTNKPNIKFSEIVTSYGMKCTFNFGTSHFDHPDETGTALTKEEIAACTFEAGHELASHGEAHAALSRLHPVEGIREVLQCREKFEKAFGRIIRGYAYADTGFTTCTNGASYEAARQYLKELGIAYARVPNSDKNDFRLPDDWYNWAPTAHHKNPELFEYIDEFLNLNLFDRYITEWAPRLFFMWGHAGEFEGDGNWDRLHAICQKFADRNDVWRATCMEIYDYVEAYNSLVFSADGRIVHNPTLKDVWFQADRTMYVVKSGETKIIE